MRQLVEKRTVDSRNPRIYLILVALTSIILVHELPSKEPSTAYVYTFVETSVMVLRSIEGLPSGLVNGDSLVQTYRPPRIA